VLLSFHGGGGRLLGVFGSICPVSILNVETCLVLVFFDGGSTIPEARESDSRTVLSRAGALPQLVAKERGRRRKRRLLISKSNGERVAEEMEGPWEMTKLSMDGILVGGAPTVPDSDTRALRI
jgi:hypothetical protein